MSGYKRKSLQLLGGSFNLLPSVDKTPQTDYLLAQNFRTDSLGRLASRYGWPQKFAIAGAGIAHSAANTGGVNSPYYVGCNSAIASPTSALYYNNSATPIATGFDGNRIAFSSQNNWMWVMNRAKQGRHNGVAAFQTWNIVAPLSSCAGGAVGTPGTSGSVTYTYAATGSPGTVHTLTIAGQQYQVTEQGIPFPFNIVTSADIASGLASLAGLDANCSVSYTSGATILISAKGFNASIAVTGSDSNTATVLATGSPSSLPSGTYVFYITYASADSSLESNPGPASQPVTVAGSAIALTAIPVSGDARTAMRNIYAAGGTLAQAYLVGSVPDNSTTTFTVSIPDLQATNTGIVMPVDNDPAPLASGMIGPHFSRLFAWSTALNPNRLFYTNPNLPQYWPGSADPAVGNWVDVGMETEAIVWCTLHTNTLVIYKERSIWMLVGPPDTGYLQVVQSDLGLMGQWAVVTAGVLDYFVAPDGLCLFTGEAVRFIGDAISPLFNVDGTNTGPLVRPGAVLAGTAFNSNSTAPYAVALGYAMGKLYIGYAEKSSGTSYCLLMFEEQTRRWFYARDNAATGPIGFFGFFFDGVTMCVLTKITSGGSAAGFNIDDFRGFFVQDSGGAAIECVYQSHYEDCGLPDNQKNFMEVVVDCDFTSTTATVYAGFDSGVTALTSIGTITTGGGRKSVSFVMGGGGQLAHNISVAVDCSSSGACVIHNVYIYYYEEARIAALASTIPIDLGVGKVKQCKELALDIDTTLGTVAVNIISDLPGNTLAVQHTIATGVTGGRALVKFPFAVTEGYLWRLTLFAVTTFRLYSARLLMRVVGTYIEAYEATAGFIWDSMEQTFDSGVTHIPRGYQIALASLPVKRAREVSLEIDTFNNAVLLTLMTDLPGNAMASRFTSVINTGTAGRRFVRIPLPQSFSSTVIEGRMYRIQISGLVKFILYSAAVDLLPVGIYVEAYEATAAAVWDSTNLDLGSGDTKTFDEIRFEMDSDSGSPVVSVYTDLPGEAMALRGGGTFALTPGPTARSWVTVPLWGAAGGPVEGRSIRLMISSGAGFRIYAAQVRASRIGRYLCANTSTPSQDALTTLDFDFASQQIKVCKRIEIDMRADGTVTLNVITNNQGGALGTTFSTSLTASTRTTQVISLPPGVNGRLIRLSMNSPNPARIYHLRIWCRTLNDPKAAWAWENYPLEEADVLPAWTDIPVAPTETQWFWAPFLSVDETADTWQWVDVPFEITE